MTAAECIDKSDYSRFKGSVPLITTGRCHPFIKDGEIYCTGTLKENNLEYGFFRTNLDGRILLGLPHSVEYQINLRNNIWNLWKRLDDFFNAVIETAEFANNDRELIQLRINVNFIYTLPIVPAEHKRAWANWIKELYWNRKVLLNQWYIENVLPF